MDIEDELKVVGQNQQTLEVRILVDMILTKLVTVRSYGGDDNKHSEDDDDDADDDDDDNHGGDEDDDDDDDGVQVNEEQSVKREELLQKQIKVRKKAAPTMPKCHSGKSVTVPQCHSATLPQC